jgi:hypothetical protein
MKRKKVVSFPDSGLKKITRFNQCPLVVYVFLGVYSGLRPVVSTIKGLVQVRIWLTIIALVVNVIVI